jgi:hypothetical protein
MKSATFAHTITARTPGTGAFANEQWNGNFYEVQQQFDDHAGGCVQLGP